MNRLPKLPLILWIACLPLSGCSSGGTDTPPASGNDVALNLAGSNQGQSLGFADVDGDGIEDKLVGAPYASVTTGTGANAAGGANTGAVLVYKGADTSYGEQPMKVLTGDDNFGFALTTAADVDGDHTNDLVVGAITGSGAEATEASLGGTVTVYKGGGSWQVLKKLAGEDPMAKFGFSLAAGDLNNDGFGDIVVGAPFNTNTPALYQAGAVFVFLGPDLTNRIALYATTTHKGLGWAVATGDVNGDGIDDLLCSASGKVLGFNGAASFAPTMTTPDLIVKSAASGFGKAIAVLGDYDGDVMKEIAIGAPNATINNNRDTGSVYIVKGGAGLRSVDLGATPVPGDLLVRIDGNALFDRFGWAIAPAGDVDQDSLTDFTVGAPWADVNANDLAGKVYLFKGKDINAATNLASATAFSGMVKNQGYGTCITANRKGQMMIGGPRATTGSGGVAMVDPATGTPVPGGSSGGATGGGDNCH